MKNPSEARGKSKPARVVEATQTETPVTVNPEIMVFETVTPEPESTGLVTQNSIAIKEPADTVVNDTHYKLYPQDLKIIKLENEQLKKEILLRITKVRELEKALSEVQREKETYENSFYEYMDRLDKVKKALESNTPSRLILEWLENGDDE